MKYLVILLLLVLPACGSNMVLVKKSTCKNIDDTGLAKCEKFEE